jgi:sphingomyelin phosphodiesterase
VNAPYEPISCEVCELLVKAFQDLIESNVSESELIKWSIEICIKYKLGGDYREMEQLCAGVVPEFAPEIIYIFSQKYVDPKRVCTALGFCKPKPLGLSALREEVKRVEALTRKPQNIPKVRKSNVKAPSNGYFFQISDLHLDPSYREGAVIDCGLPLCCRTGNSTQPGNSSRLWGEYECDPPQRMVQAALSVITQDQEKLPDFVLWTGDTPPHDIWEESQVGQVKRMKAVSDLLYAMLGNNIPVYPAFGNHDTFPVDQFAEPPLNQWLMNNISLIWGRWLSSSALTTLRIGGYYSVTPEAGLRIISINTQYCDNVNFWLWLDHEDPTGQLAWLTTELSAAESNNEKVYIIGHIPPGDDTCESRYSRKYFAIVQRFNQTIAGQFFGHTHHDAFQVFREAYTDAKPMNLAYIAPSITPYTKTNPSVRRYEFYSDTREIVDYTQFHTDLEETNKNNKPNFVEYYSAKQAYGLDSLRPDSWYDLIERMKQNDTLVQLVYHHKYTGYYDSSTCDKSCKKELICSLSNAVADLYRLCVDL